MFKTFEASGQFYSISDVEFIVIFLMLLNSENITKNRLDIGTEWAILKFNFISLVYFWPIIER